MSTITTEHTTATTTTTKPEGEVVHETVVTETTTTIAPNDVDTVEYTLIFSWSRRLDAK